MSMSKEYHIVILIVDYFNKLTTTTMNNKLKRLFQTVFLKIEASCSFASQYLLCSWFLVARPLMIHLSPCSA